MKVSELLTEKMEYDPQRGTLVGDTKEWLASAGINIGDKEFFKSALEQLKKTNTWKELEKTNLKYVGTQRELANGTLSFNVPRDSKKYIIHGHGQIRLQSLDYPETRTRLKSPKPKLVVGNPMKSMVSTWENSLSELLNKHKKKIKKADK